ncbi:MAG: beta-ketoacyl-ACP synthase II [Deltaproteobacteria bacterium]|nr:beta-ketoacyl-ACP synthase II [Deltaproteobacteria bacterium]
MKRRVVVTGLGLVTSLGIGVEKNWHSITNGISGITLIDRFDVSEYRTKIAGMVKDFNPEDYIPAKEVKKLDRFIHYAVAMATESIKDSGLVVTDANAHRIGCVIGCGLGGLETLETHHKVLLESGPRRVTPFFIPKLISNMAPGEIAIQFGLKGPNISVQTACASGNHAIGDSFKLIQRGAADVMVTGGVEATITPLALAGFSSMKALSSRNDEPLKASRPFDRDRDGFVMAEGGGSLVLEELDFAMKRGAKIYAELVGYGLNADAYHMTAPSPDGDGAIRCMRLALADAEVAPSQITCINAHGTSTPLNDASETLAMKAVFKDHAYNLVISATKSMTGHLLGGAGGVESVFSCLTIKNGVVPPTINYDNKDDACDLDYVPNQAREMAVPYVLSNSFGFGGTNACLLFKEFNG